jgi:hypothetical protein
MIHTQGRGWDMDARMIILLLWTCLLIGLVATPFLIGFGWRAITASGAVRPVAIPRVLLTLESLSYVWFLALLFFRGVIGPDYSDLRFRTIYVNLVCMVGIGVVGCLRGGRARAPLLWAAGALVALWTYAVIVSSVV